MYPSAEQAAAAAMAASGPGDAVFVHTDSCATENDVGCTCEPEEYTLTAEGWRMVPKPVSVT